VSEDSLELSKSAHTLSDLNQPYSYCRNGGIYSLSGRSPAVGSLRHMILDDKRRSVLWRSLR